MFAAVAWLFQKLGVLAKEGWIELQRDYINSYMLSENRFNGARKIAPVPSDSSEIGSDERVTEHFECNVDEDIDYNVAPGVNPRTKTLQNLVKLFECHKKPHKEESVVYPGHRSPVAVKSGMELQQEMSGGGCIT
ncbi:hypothetical protein K435DRAFT_810460 [Dendrothele bispora CBS 962.96]|uniref:Uncharacterized protein n=1 Tax=Dendrothele bispora (strain CBS 962.96) TaxID=1314807 RepID=A0A4S8KVE8_DENBC|nr:hypothetical protein K435DRAFT_810460 [Dendrothele bispora CBS 962.96]